MTVQHSGNTLYMAMELSAKTWKLRFGDGIKVRGQNVRGGDVVSLAAAMATARRRFGLPAGAPVRSCYEAGRDGFWLHRWLTQKGVENLVVDPASIQVDRRQRRAKTDRLDAEKLLLMLLRYWLYGERTVWKVCHVPSEAAEDGRRPHRELDRLVKERTGHVNRIRALLNTQGTCVGDPLNDDLSKLLDWEGKRLSAALVAELVREQQRLKQLVEQIRTLVAERKLRLAEPVSDADHKVRKLIRLRGIGPVGSGLLVRELFGWREFRNRRQVGAVAGLAGTPYDSGESHRDQGISKAGNRWVRKICIELAWAWVRYQPGSALSLWFVRRFGHGGKRQRRIGIVALARKLLVALWKYVEKDEMPEGAVTNVVFVR